MITKGQFSDFYEFILFMTFVISMKKFENHIQGEFGKIQQLPKLSFSWFSLKTVNLG